MHFSSRWQYPSNVFKMMAIEIVYSLQVFFFLLNKIPMTFAVYTRNARICYIQAGKLFTGKNWGLNQTRPCYSVWYRVCRYPIGESVLTNVTRLARSCWSGLSELPNSRWCVCVCLCVCACMCTFSFFFLSYLFFLFFYILFVPVFWLFFVSVFSSFF